MLTCCLYRKRLGIATRASTAVSLGALPLGALALCRTSDCCWPILHACTGTAAPGAAQTRVDKALVCETATRGAWHASYASPIDDTRSLFLSDYVPRSFFFSLFTVERTGIQLATELRGTVSDFRSWLEHIKTLTCSRDCRERSRALINKISMRVLYVICFSFIIVKSRKIEVLPFPLRVILER